MQIKITYVFHNCFIVKLPDKTLLFDYPGPEFLNAAIEETVLSQINATNLYVFASHFHPDHFNREVTRLGAKARQAKFIFSKDIVKKNPGFRDNPSCLAVAPDQAYPLDDLTITTFRSNDAGVAFLIRACARKSAGLAIYFGGDLANWAWEDNNRQERQLLEEYFGAVLERIQKILPAGQPLHIAFSNTDARLKNWSGAAQFIAAVNPRLFVPMHAFGQTDTITGFIAEHPQIQTPLFHYQKTGDEMILDVAPATG